MGMKLKKQYLNLKMVLELIAVHIESKLMADHLTEQAIQQGENILLPKVGHRLDKIKKALYKN